MSVALIPGTFDPITVGHEDLIQRASMLFDEVIVCVFTNSAKNTMFTPEERYEFLCAVADNYRNVHADLCTGLLADYAIEHRCDVIIKGARSGTDFDYEFSMSAINRELAPMVETIILPSRCELSHISSTMVRELIKYGKDYAPFVPSSVANLI